MRNETCRAIRDVLCLDDFEALAKGRLPRPLFSYISGASERNASLDDNNKAFSEYGFMPKVLQNVSGRSSRSLLMGQQYAVPFGIAPMGISALMAYRGDIVLASAAREAGIPMIMSGSSLIRLEEVMDVAPDTWFQAYLPGDETQIDSLVDRVAATACETLVLTVDVAILPSRENNVRAGFSTPLRPSLGLAWQGITHPRWTFGTFARTLLTHGMPHFENSSATRGAPIISQNIARDFSRRDHLNWEHLQRIRRRWKGRLVVKGLMREDDAITATGMGADGLIISNHGGRQLDGTISPLRMLPRIVEAVGGKATVMMDGGVRRGTDVVKALALGAEFVFVGRPFLYAATVGGFAGVSKAARLLREEIHRDMALIGVNSVGELSRTLIERV